MQLALVGLVGRTAIVSCLGIVALAAIFDVATRRIPNVITLGGIALGLAIHGALGFVDGGAGGIVRGVLLSLAGVAVCGILPVFSFARNEMGGGDVKLFGAIGALCGPALGFDVESYTFVVLLAVVLPYRLLRHGAFVASLRNGVVMVRNGFVSRERRAAYAPVKLPPVILGPAIVAGTCLALVVRGALR